MQTVYEVIHRVKQPGQVGDTRVVSEPVGVVHGCVATCADGWFLVEGLVGAHVEDPRVRALVVGLDARPVSGAVRVEVSPDGLGGAPWRNSAQLRSRSSPGTSQAAPLRRRRAISAQLAAGYSINATAISSRSCNASGAPGMLVRPSVGVFNSTGHHDRNRAPPDGTGRPSEFDTRFRPIKGPAGAECGVPACLWLPKTALGGYGGGVSMFAATVRRGNGSASTHPLH